MTETSLIKQNYFYNTLLTVLNLIFPLITFPYVSRILGPEGIGKVNFAMAFSQQFLLFANLGIPLYGMREIAKCRSDKEHFDKTYSELIILNVISMLVFISVYFFLTFFLKKLQNDISLYLIFSLNILLCVFSLDWFYKGIEKFRYITIRSIILKVFSIIILLIFVKGREDYNAYAICLVIAISGANLYNLIHSRKFAKFQMKNLNLRKHFKGILTTFLIFAIIQIYIGMDKIMIGFISGDLYVGYYTVAERISRILITVVISLSTVLIPKMSYYHSMNENEKFINLVDMSIKYVMILSIPIIVGIFALDNEIIMLFAGNEFSESCFALKIMSFIILAVGLANVAGMQILYSTGQENKYLISITFGMIIALIVNILLIPIFQHNGAAVGTLLAEVCGLIIQISFCWKIIRPILFNFSNVKYFIAAGIMGIGLILTNQINGQTMTIKIIFWPIAGVIIYFFSLLLLKEKYVVSLWNLIFKKPT